MESLCFECGKPADHNHHVLPQSKGGTKTIPLCKECHSVVHDSKLVKMSYLSESAKQKIRSLDAMAKISEMFESGESKSEISRKLSISRGSVYSALKKLGFYEKTGEGLGGKFNSKILKEIRELRKQKIKWTEICERLDLSSTHLFRILKKKQWHDNVFAHASRENYRTMSEEKKEQAYKLREEGKSWQEVANVLGVNLATLYRWKIPQGHKHLRGQLTDEKYELGIALRLQGKNLNEVASELGVSRGALFNRDFHKDPRIQGIRSIDKLGADEGLPRGVTKIRKSGKYLVVVSCKSERFRVGLFEDLEIAKKAANLAIELLNSGCRDNSEFIKIKGDIL